MKIALTLLFLLVACASPAQVRTLTRTVTLFGDLERRLAATTNSTDRGLYLAEDFEERRCADPGNPVPREEWLSQPQQKFSFSQQAVHDYGDTALYSALALTAEKQFAIVDTWRKHDTNWRLAVRYICPSTGEKRAESPPKRY